jgi:UDP-N-acetylglucosamine--N-acetylmuramyl-(pentapeptide) pyrophosphoryl-undecaprenol N-acetylglucosamine transferase
VGGSLGAGPVNDVLRESLPRLLPLFDIVHLTGSGKHDPRLTRAGYVQLEYVGAEMGDVLAAADIMLSRAGANAIFEFLALQKPALLVPLTAASSRGDQLQNAEYMKKMGYSAVLPQEEMTVEALTAAIKKLYAERGAYIGKMAVAKADGTDEIVRRICESI